MAMFTTERHPQRQTRCDVTLPQLSFQALQLLRAHSDGVVQLRAHSNGAVPSASPQSPTATGTGISHHYHRKSPDVADAASFLLLDTARPNLLAPATAAHADLDPSTFDDSAFPVPGEWSTATQALKALQDRAVKREIHRASEGELWRRSRVRAFFDLWYRQYRRANRRVVWRLAQNNHRNGKTARCKQAFARWMTACEMMRRRAMRKLQQVADFRLSLLLNTEAHVSFKPVQQLAMRWTHVLTFKVFSAWRDWCAPSPPKRRLSTRPPQRLHPRMLNAWQIPAHLPVPTRVNPTRRVPYAGFGGCVLDTTPSMSAPAGTTTMRCSSEEPAQLWSCSATAALLVVRVPPTYASSVLVPSVGGQSSLNAVRLVPSVCSVRSRFGAA